MKNLADENMILFDREKNVVGLLTVAVQAQLELVGPAAEARKLSDQFEAALKPLHVTDPSGLPKSGATGSKERRAPARASGVNL